MNVDGTELVKLGPNQSPPEEGDIVVAAKRERSGGWTAEIVAGLLFKETIPGTFNSLDAALAESVRHISRTRLRPTIYYRANTGARRIIKKTRYVRA